MQINVVDAIMGSGKTSAAINMINNCEDEEKRFIFITPFLTEVERILESCSSKNFKQPKDLQGSKLSNLNYLISQGENIVSTHALFQTCKNNTAALLQEYNYTLILDEVCEVIQTSTINSRDLKIILNQLAHVEEDRMVWNEDKIDYDGVFVKYKNMSQNGNMLVYQDSILLWTLPVQLFNAFSEVFILTYMFEAQFQKYYYDYYDIEYNKMSVEYNKETGYEFIQDIDIYKMPEYTQHLKDLITIVDNTKMNDIGKQTDRSQPLCSTWYDRQHGTGTLKQFKKHLLNFYRNISGTSSKYNMWTTFKKSRNELQGNGYVKGFVPMTARATNEYGDKTSVAYTINVFMNPVVKNFFTLRGIEVDEDAYALSEMLQWVWRSAIRNGEPITLYIPSERMRNLFTGWLDSLRGEE